MEGGVEGRGGEERGMKRRKGVEMWEDMRMERRWSGEEERVEGRDGEEGGVRSDVG